MRVLIRLRNLRGLVLIASFFLTYSIYAQPATPVPTEIPGVESTYKLTPSQLASGDLFGTSVARIGDLNNDGNEDIVVGAPGDDASSVNYGAIYVCLMNSDGTPDTCVLIDADNAVLTGNINRDDDFGWSVAGLGDVNGDGFEDIAVGAPRTNVGDSDDGAVWVLFMDTVDVVSVSSIMEIAHDRNGFPDTYLGRQDYFGSSVALIGDINGDGINDLAVGARNYESGSNRYGGVFVLLMEENYSSVHDAVEITDDISGFPPALSLSDEFGYSVSGAGDLNGDGIYDMVVGADLDDDGGTNTGALWILYLNSSGAVDDYKKLSLPLRNKIYDYYDNYNFGTAIAVTDINGDGQQDFYVGASGSSGSVFYAITLDSLENPLGVRKYSTTNNSINSGAALTTVGRSISTIQDYNNDGKFEILVGQTSDNSNSGAIYVVSMDELTYDVTEGIVGHMSMIGDVSGNFSATLDNNDRFGRAVTRLGDVNGDGIDDIAVGAHLDDDGGTSRGAVYILFLDTMGNVSSYQKLSHGTGNLGSLDDGDQFGLGVFGPGDLDGDDIPDLYVGAIGDDDGGTDRGTVYRILLNSNGTAKSGRVRKIGPGGNGGFSGTCSAQCAFGASITVVGDINNDGENDLAIGAPTEDDGGTDRGSVWILKMTSDTTTQSGYYQEISYTTGDFSYSVNNLALFGAGVDQIGDFGGASVPDLLVGSPYMDTTGAAFILYLDTSGKVDSFVRINYKANNFPESLSDNGNFAYSAINAGDIDGNGTIDLLIGQIDYSSFGTNKGAIWLTFLDTAGNVTRVQNISERYGWCYANSNTDDDFGVALTKYGLDSSEMQMNFFVGSHLRDEGNTNRGVVHQLGLATAHSSKLYTTDYATLTRKLDGNHYLLTSNNLLYFKFEGEYNDDTLKFNVYNISHIVVASETLYTPALYNTISGSSTMKFGDNRFRLNFGCNGGLQLPIGSYILEVINQKNEKFYLRVKKTYGNPCLSQVFTYYK